MIRTLLLCLILTVTSVCWAQDDWTVEDFMAETGVRMVGKILLGTVKGDLHDIGKNLVGMMCEGAGFQVIDLGFNLPPEKFTEAIKEHQPDIVGMSALLTTTMPYMKVVIDTLVENTRR